MQINFQLAERYASIEQGIQQLDDRIAGKTVTPAATGVPAPTTAAPAAPSAPALPAATPAASVVPAQTATAADAPVKLGYQQEDVLQAAQFNLREVQGNVAALSDLMAQLQPVADQMSINYRQVQKAMANVENARRKAEFTLDGLNKLPANARGVAETAAELTEANVQLDAAESYFTPLNQQLTKLIDRLITRNWPILFKRQQNRSGKLATTNLS